MLCRKLEELALILRKSATVQLNVQESIPSNSGYTTYSHNSVPTKTLHRIANTDCKTDYVLMDETEDMLIYNPAKRKAVRTIPHKVGSLQKGIIPVKDGHIMIVKYNKKEKYTRVFIEQI